ncbi:MAG: hypothetical protein KJO05_07830 [Bacteroidia bacterium]|nr:hypothetical protein [Bacteroidia bacterium]NNF31450.1 hypothetical protein [Flavobacteriaceae bacterium]MBT8275525.1 hypothetical protein [Bacteroidia bacterium]NNJ82075.1 hypothetical protein [Flavobacteriaceae bacterium]NNK54029.1 hypothetical protein [Flavobacteriaceae bacterium]
MKKLIYTILIALCTGSAMYSQESSEDYSEKVNSIDSIIETLYGVISGEKGEERNWELFKFLFTPDAKLIPSGKNADNTYNVRYMTPSDYIELAGKWLIENGFYEKEIYRKTESFGNVTHVFSTYESYYSSSDKEPFMRGINSIQLLDDGNRWWVVNIYWTAETDEDPIPVKYLPKRN